MVTEKPFLQCLTGTATRPVNALSCSYLKVLPGCFCKRCSLTQLTFFSFKGFLHPSSHVNSLGSCLKLLAPWSEILHMYPPGHMSPLLVPPDSFCRHGPAIFVPRCTYMLAFRCMLFERLFPQEIFIILRTLSIKQSHIFLFCTTHSQTAQQLPHLFGNGWFISRLD